MSPRDLAALPAGRLLISDLCRHLPPDAIRTRVGDRSPKEGDIAIAEVLEIGRHPMLALASGRHAELAPGDHIVVALGTVHAPLDFSGTCPSALGEVALLGASGSAGIVRAASRGLPPTRLRLLGLAGDAAGDVLNLRRQTGQPAGPAAEALRIAVISCARGSHASKVTAALLRGLARSGLAVGVAKPTGVADSSERWRFLDAGASAAVDLVDAGHLCSAALAPDQLTSVLQRLYGALDGYPAVVVRVAGGLARRDTRALLAAPAFASGMAGVVLAAADALSAIEGARLVSAAGVPLLALSGAICRSPLAMAEARAGLPCPVLDTQALAVPARLQALIGEGRRPSAGTMPAVELSIAA